MQGLDLLRYSLRKAPVVLEQIWPGLSNGLGDISLVIPHQTSQAGLMALQRFFPSEKMVLTLEQYGNCISVSIPLSLHEAIQDGRLRRGDKCLLIGTGAGLSIAGIVLTY